MNQILLIRKEIINVYKRFEEPINYGLKFILGIIIFSFINRLGYASVVNKLPVVLLAAILTAILPNTWVFVLIALFITIHLYYASMLLSIFIGMLLLCLILFYVRIFPKQSYLIIALFLGYFFKVPYAVPIFAGIFVGLSGIPPLVIGAFLWKFLEVLPGLIPAARQESLGISDLIDTVSGTYVTLMNAITNNQEWVYLALVFSVVAIITYIISRLHIDYSGEIAIVIGALVNFIGFIVAVLVGGMDIGVFELTLSTIVSALLVLLCRFFSIVLDYSGAQSVQFQDENNLYYVKVVPKINVEKPRAKVKKVIKEPLDETVLPTDENHEHL